MNNFKILAHSIMFVLFAITMSGCDSSDSSGSGSGSGTASLKTTPASSFDFQTVTVGNSALLELVITNDGNERLNIANIALSDPNNFSLDTGVTTDPNDVEADRCFTLSPVLSPNGQCTIEVRFVPTTAGLLSATAGLFSATLDITSNAPAKQLTLTGTGDGINALKLTINQVDLNSCPLVTAYVSVTDQEGFPYTETTANFTITENSNPVTSSTETTIGDATEAISIALVMDNSSSLQNIDITEMNDAANKIVDELSGADEAEIIKFSTGIDLKQEFTSDKTLLKTAIDTAVNRGTTALYDTLIEAIDDTALRPSERKAVIVITDGNDSDTSAIPDPLIANAQSKGVPIFVIGIGEDVDTTPLGPLGKIATETSGELYAADVAQNLRTIVQQQLTEVLFTDQYILTYTSNKGAPDLKIDVTDNSLTGSSVTDPPGFTYTTCP